MSQSQTVLSNMSDRQWESNNGSAQVHSMLPLPLNLIAMIINYVRSILFIPVLLGITNGADHGML